MVNDIYENIVAQFVCLRTLLTYYLILLTDFKTVSLLVFYKIKFIIIVITNYIFNRSHIEGLETHIGVMYEELVDDYKLKKEKAEMLSAKEQKIHFLTQEVTRYSTVQ